MRGVTQRGGGVMIKVYMYICIYPDKVGSVSLEQLQNKRNLEIQNQQQQQNTVVSGVPPPNGGGGYGGYIAMGGMHREICEV